MGLYSISENDAIRIVYTLPMRKNLTMIRLDFSDKELIVFVDLLRKIFRTT